MKNLNNKEYYIEIAKYLLEEVVKVSLGVHKDAMTAEEADKKLGDKAHKCVEKYGSKNSFEGLKIFHETLRKSAPKGLLKFNKKDGTEIFVPVLKSGVEEYFSSQVKK